MVESMQLPLRWYPETMANWIIARMMSPPLAKDLSRRSVHSFNSDRGNGVADVKTSHSYELCIRTMSTATTVLTCMGEIRGRDHE
jgi:hypothetical protein